MQRITCDRCGADCAMVASGNYLAMELTVCKGVELVVAGETVAPNIDLCSKCRYEFQYWMKAGGSEIPFDTE